MPSTGFGFFGHLQEVNRHTYSQRWLIMSQMCNCWVKQDRQCTYDVTSRRVLATIVVVEKHWVLRILRVCVCSLRYTTCNAHAPYCHLWRALLYNIFPLYLINGTILGEKLLNIKCVFWFPLLVWSETFLILRRIQRDMIKKSVPVFM
jgi:hypothetical protein